MVVTTMVIVMAVLFLKKSSVLNYVTYFRDLVTYTYIFVYVGGGSNNGVLTQRRDQYFSKAQQRGRFLQSD